MQSSAVLTSLTIQPYLAEIGWLTGAALYEFDRLEMAAAAWLRLDAEWRRANHHEQDAPEGAGVAQGDNQIEMFTAIEAFVATWSRLSYFLWPASRPKEFATKRAALLREVLALPTERLKDRDLRDAWMHFDERLDLEIEAERRPNRQRFTRSEEAKSDRASIRLIEVDTLRVRFRKHGKYVWADLHECRDALLEVELHRNGVKLPDDAVLGSRVEYDDLQRSSVKPPYQGARRIRIRSERNRTTRHEADASDGAAA
jgi:hypothetical protein